MVQLFTLATQLELKLRLSLGCGNYSVQFQTIFAIFDDQFSITTFYEDVDNCYSFHLMRLPTNVRHIQKHCSKNISIEH